MITSQKITNSRDDTSQFTSPFTFFVQKPLCQAFLSICAALLFYNTYVVLSGIPTYSVSNFADFKININLFFQENTTTQHSIRTAIVYLLRKGCIAATANTTFIGLSVACPLHLASPLEVDGFQVSFIPADIEPSAASLLLLGTGDGGRTWAVAGSSTYRFVSGGVRFLSPAAVPWPRGTVVTGPNSTGPAEGLRFDYRPRWPIMAEQTLAGVIGGIGLISIAALGAMERPVGGRRAFIWLSALEALNSVAAAAALGCVCGAREVLRPLANAGLYAVAAGSLPRGGGAGFFERLVGLSAAAVAVRVVDDCAVHEDCGNLSASPPVFALCAAAAALVFLLYRRLRLAAAVSAVAEDRARLDAVWDQLRADPTVREALRRLDALCRKIEEAYGGPAAAAVRARQFNRPRISLRASGLVAAGRQQQSGENPVPGHNDGFAKKDPSNAGKSAWIGFVAMASRMRSRRRRALQQLHELLRWESRDEDFDSRNTVPGRADETRPVNSLDQLYGIFLFVELSNSHAHLYFQKHERFL